MKRLFSLCVALFATIFLFANQQGHFFMDLNSQNVVLTNIANSFGSYFNFANESTFALFRDTIDALGIRHQSYQQYYQGKEVESHVVIVHSKNGIVSCINGSAMTQAQAPQSVVARISQRQAAAKAPKKVEESAVIPVVKCIDGEYYSVYKVPSPETFEILYVDANTGEIICRESVFRNADVAGRGYTRYKGWQNMTVYESDGLYYLMDVERNMISLSAESVSPNSDYYLNDNFINTLPNDVQSALLDPDLQKDYLMQYILSPMMNDYIRNSCSSLYFESSDVYTPRIKSITISSAASSWWYDLWDTKPDLYCKICDPNGNVLYTTSTKEDCTLPVTFTFTKGIVVSKGCMVKIYDADATSDSYGGSVSLTTVTPGTKTWSGSYTSGSIEIIDSPIEYADIHWGMQKTLDFYQSTFGRNSFDNNGHVVINLAFPPQDQVIFKNMPNNAAAQSTFEPYYMYYGWGDDSSMNPVVGLDVMAHEFTHMVTGCNGNGGLEYKSESGALNESFSDIMAMGVMQYTFGTCDWTIGADIMISAPNMRSMSNPNNSGGANGVLEQGAQPDTYMGDCWYPTLNPSEENDNGGVHTNSGVQNYWFYLLSMGGSGTNDIGNAYDVSNIGIDEAVQIAYRNLIFYLVPNATFEDSRNGSIQAAIDLYGKGSQEHQSVVNAWYAVGVGDAYVDDSEPFTLTPGKYIIVANRDKTGDKNWYYMTSDLGTASNKRFQAVSTETENIDDIVITELEDTYIWDLEADGTNWKLKNGDQYVSWSSGNTTKFDATGKSLIFEVEENRIQAHFNDGTNERYLALNATTGNNYFAFYSGTNQQINLYFLPYEEEEPPVIPQPESDRYVVLAQRNASSNWFYMTSDLGTASNKRYQAVDAGTSTLSEVTTTNLEDKYYWEIEENKLKTGTQYSTWTSGNTANLDATGKELTIQKQTDGTYTFSFVDGADTRYLALNATAGNDYFAYYKGTNQIYRLTLVKEGGNGSTVGVENIVEQPSATKVLMNGQILILRGDKTYTLTGQEVK